MSRIFSIFWKKIYSYASLLTALILLALFLSSRICVNIKCRRDEKLHSILLLSKTAETAMMQGFIPAKAALPSLERAYHIGGDTTKPYAGFLSSCFYIHNEPLRGAYYAGLAYGSGAHLHLPSPVQVLLKEISDSQSVENYREALQKSKQLLELISSSPDYPTLKFLTLLRMIAIKDLLKEDVHEEMQELQSLPLFKEFEEFYKDGEWTLSRRFEYKYQEDQSSEKEEACLTSKTMNKG